VEAAGVGAKRKVTEGLFFCHRGVLLFIGQTRRSLLAILKHGRRGNDRAKSNKRTVIFFTRGPGGG
jgi:hypothetical protein